ncbi:hypothetical protein [Hyphomicrobium facile]|uniref:hypothetical protein n=1 Tax=Hyphomicrobium facile TaxID=51670 RepID=UPI0015A7300A|nr:hypothetical protein [Hyphomicrobium facile]
MKFAAVIEAFSMMRDSICESAKKVMAIAASKKVIAIVAGKRWDECAIPARCLAGGE